MGGGGGGAVNLPFNTSLISSAVDFGVGCLIPSAYPSYPFGSV